MSDKKKENEHKGKSVKCFCNKCNTSINHKVLTDISEEGSFTEDGTNWIDRFQIIECLGCNTIRFRKHSFFSEYRDYDNDGWYEEIYPDIKKNHRKELEFDYLPENLSNIYEETISSFNLNNYILCSVGIRAILEGACKDKNITSSAEETDSKKAKPTLYNLIDTLDKDRLISKTQCKILHELRFLGNTAIHELEYPSRKGVSLAIDIIEHILNDLYDIPAKAHSLDRIQRNKKSI